MSLVFNSEVVLNRQLGIQFGLRHVILEAAAIETNREKSSLQFVIFIVVFAKADASYLVLVRLHFATERPLHRLRLITVEMLFFENRYTVVGVGGGKIAATVACNDL